MFFFLICHSSTKQQFPGPAVQLRLIVLPKELSSDSSFWCQFGIPKNSPGNDEISYIFISETSENCWFPKKIWSVTKDVKHTFFLTKKWMVFPHFHPVFYSSIQNSVRVVVDATVPCWQVTTITRKDCSNLCEIFAFHLG